MDKFNPKEARHILTLQATKDILIDWNFKWDKCYGALTGKNYEVKYERSGVVVRVIEYSHAIYQNEIKKGRNDWLNNKILNRSELAGRIWNDDISQNKLRRRLETKAYWNTFTDNEKINILKQVADFYAEVVNSFGNLNESKSENLTKPNL